jgi:thiamine-phosphate pyrophosphorylase
MKLIVISYPEKIEKEESFIPLLFDNGLEYFHLRKPGWEKGQVVDLLKGIPIQYHGKIIIHDNWNLMNDFDLGGIHVREKDKHSLSNGNCNFHSIAVHKLEELYKIEKEFKPARPAGGYALLSPIFNSISKKNVNAAFNLDDLKVAFASNRPQVPIYALGGIDLKNIFKAKEIGFDGVAILGFIWNIYKDKGSKEAILNFKKLQVLCQ